MSRSAWLVLGSLMIWGVGEGLFLFIEPLYLERLGAAPTQVGGVLAVAALVVTLSYIPAGWLSDHFNRKFTMLGGYLMGLGGVLLMSIARDWIQLVPGLLLYSLSGYCMPVITSYLAWESSPDQRARTINFGFALYSVGLLFSPALGGWLAELWSMPTVFHLSAFCFTLSTLAVMMARSQPLVRQSQAVNEGRPEVLVWGRPHVRPLILLSLFLFSFAYLGYPLAPNFLEEIAGYDFGRIGFLGSAHAAGAALFGILLARLDKIGRWGLLVALLLVALYGIIIVLTSSLPLLLLAFLLRGALQTLTPLLATRLAALVDERALGYTFGVVHAVQGIGRMIAPASAGFLFIFAPRLPFLVSSVALLLLAALYLLFERAIVQEGEPVRRPVGGTAD